MSDKPRPFLGSAGDLLTSLQLAVLAGLLQVGVVWGLAREPHLLRPIVIVTISTITVTRTVEVGPASNSGWSGVRGSYFRLILVLISFCAVIYAVSVRPADARLYVWDVLALVAQVVLSNAAVAYAREVR